MKPMSHDQLISSNTTVCNHYMNPLPAQTVKYVINVTCLDFTYLQLVHDSCQLQLKLVNSRNLRNLVGNMTLRNKKTKPASKLLADYFIPSITHNATNYDLHWLLKD